MNPKIYNLFPSPVFEYNINRKITNTENKFIHSLDYNKNVFNLISVDNFILNQEPLNDIKNFINTSLNDCFNYIFQPKNDMSIYITESWVNVTKKEESHHYHNHPNSFLSGVMYIDSDNDRDTIQFHKNIQQFPLYPETSEYNIYNSASWWLPAKTGTLYLFPSSLHHSVEKPHGDNLRISISFNTFIKGTINQYKQQQISL